MAENIEAVYQKATDVVSQTVSYVVESELGRSESSALWRIKKIETANGVTTEKYPLDANGNPSSDFEFAWSQRASLTYSFDKPAPVYVSIDPTYLSVSAEGNPIPDVFTATYTVASPIASVEVTADEGLEVSAVSVSGDDTITFTTVTYAAAQYDVTIKVTDTFGSVLEHTITLENL